MEQGNEFELKVKNFNPMTHCHLCLDKLSENGSIPLSQEIIAQYKELTDANLYLTFSQVSNIDEKLFTKICDSCMRQLRDAATFKTRIIRYRHHLELNWKWSRITSNSAVGDKCVPTSPQDPGKPKNEINEVFPEEYTVAESHNDAQISIDYMEETHDIACLLCGSNEPLGIHRINGAAVEDCIQCGRNVEPRPISMYCAVCNINITSIDAYRMHFMEPVHKNKKFHHCFCKTFFTSSKSLTIHKQQRHCETCNNLYEKTLKFIPLEKHNDCKNNALSHESVKCTVCQAIPGTRNHPPNTILCDCPHCGYVQVNNFMEKDPIICEYCPVSDQFSTVRMSHYRVHLVTHHADILKFSCPFCSFGFYSSEALQAHFMHGYHRSCKICDIHFMSVKHFKEHAFERHQIMLKDDEINEPAPKKVEHQSDIASPKTKPDIDSLCVVAQGSHKDLKVMPVVDTFLPDSKSLVVDTDDCTAQSERSHETLAVHEIPTNIQKPAKDKNKPIVGRILRATRSTGLVPNSEACKLCHVALDETVEIPRDSKKCQCPCCGKNIAIGTKNIPKNKTYSCEFCNFKADQLPLILMHFLDSHQKDISSFICRYCKRLFYNPEALKYHVKIYHADRDADKENLKIGLEESEKKPAAAIDVSEATTTLQAHATSESKKVGKRRRLRKSSSKEDLSAADIKKQNQPLEPQTKRHKISNSPVNHTKREKVPEPVVAVSKASNDNSKNYTTEVVSGFCHECDSVNAKSDKKGTTERLAFQKCRHNIVVSKMLNPTVKMFKCTLCTFKTFNRTEIQDHVSQMHSKAFIRFRCIACPLFATSLEEIKTHYEASHNFCCTFPGCEKQFLRLQALQGHIKRHKRSNNKS